LTLEQLLDDAPAIHGATGEALLTHGLLEEALAFIDEKVRPGDRTLETGSGYSTILLAIKGAEHTCVVPNQPEVDRILAYCEGRSIDTALLSFYVAPSERVLPGLELPSLDLALIDGSHSFPQVFLDWFYTGHALAVGGHLLIDDVHVWTGRVLRDFLVEEPEWALLDELGGRTAIFAKTAQTDPDRLWTHQPYVLAKTQLGARTTVRQAASMVRHGHARELARRTRAVLGRATRDRLGR
jgi:hypothetical protein